MVTRLVVLIVFAVLSSLVAQTTTKKASDYLPLAVGNSWTYLQEHWYVRANQHGLLYQESYDPAEFTLSILRTEVIDGETYYVFSDVPSDLPTDVPGHFIAGKKLRWDGNNLTEHDGTSPVSLYRFDIPTADAEITSEYSIATTHGDTLVKTYAGISSSGLLHQGFQFDGEVPQDGSDFSRLVRFIETFGLSAAKEIWSHGDAIVATKSLTPVRALRIDSTQGEQGVRGSDTLPIAVEWEDFNCFYRGYDVRFGTTCNYPPTSTRRLSWGSVKNESR